jgi:uncharacterized cupin superfamily protein
MRRGRHHGHAAKTSDIGCEVGRSLRQQDFRYVAEGDIYICPAGEKLTHHFTNEENGLVQLIVSCATLTEKPKDRILPAP